MYIYILFLADILVFATFSEQRKCRSCGGEFKTFRKLAAHSETSFGNFIRKLGFQHSET